MADVSPEKNLSLKATGNIDQNNQRNNVARQVEVFCISYIAAFSVILIQYITVKLCFGGFSTLKNS